MPDSQPHRLSVHRTHIANLLPVQLEHAPSGVPIREAFLHKHPAGDGGFQQEIGAVHLLHHLLLLPAVPLLQRGEHLVPGAHRMQMQVAAHPGRVAAIPAGDGIFLGLPAALAAALGTADQHMIVILCQLLATEGDAGLLLPGIFVIIERFLQLAEDGIFLQPLQLLGCKGQIQSGLGASEVQAAQPGCREKAAPQAYGTHRHVHALDQMGDGGGDVARNAPHGGLSCRENHHRAVLFQHPHDVHDTPGIGVELHLGNDAHAHIEPV